MKNIILASTSPRRQHLLALLGVEHTVRSSEFDEYAVKPEVFNSLPEYVQAIGAGKVLELTTRLSEDELSSAIIIGGDLSTFVDTKPFHKPKDFDEARRSFMAFTGLWHDEIASVAVWSQEKGLTVSSTHSRIYTPKLTENELKIYLEGAHPLDKSGGYSLGAVTRTLKLSGREKEVLVEGDVTTILGFPVQLVAQLLKEHGVTVPIDPAKLEHDVAQEIMSTTMAKPGQILSMSRKMKI
jgi:septum formation protein